MGNIWETLDDESDENQWTSTKSQGWNAYGRKDREGIRRPLFGRSSQARGHRSFGGERRGRVSLSPLSGMRPRNANMNATAAASPPKVAPQ